MATAFQIFSRRFDFLWSPCSDLCLRPHIPLPSRPTNVPSPVNVPLSVLFFFYIRILFFARLDSSPIVNKTFCHCSSWAAIDEIASPVSPVSSCHFSGPWFYMRLILRPSPSPILCCCSSSLSSPGKITYQLVERSEPARSSLIPCPTLFSLNFKPDFFC